MNFNAPHIDYAGLSPVIALTAGLVVVLMVGLIPRLGRFTMAYLTIAVLADDGRPRDLAVGLERGPGRRARCGSTRSACRRR